MRKICVITGTRAEYGILKPVLNAIQDSSRLELSLIVTGMHLLEKFGSTYQQIESDGFRIDRKVPCASEADTSDADMAKSIGNAVIRIADALEELKPDIFLVPCDRHEMLGAAIAGFYTRCCVAHLHGGEKSQTFDDSARHAITKLAHIHLAATEQSAQRIIRLGEQENRVFVVGAPGLDTILKQKLLSRQELENRLGISLENPTALVVQHPTDDSTAEGEMRETLEAIKQMKMQAIIIYPNSDAGGRRMINVIEEYAKLPQMSAFASLEHTAYLSLLKHAAVIVGNSSSAIIEAPSFGIPVINIGIRQDGRERAGSTIDIACRKEDISKAVQNALTKEFQKAKSNIKNPYGDGSAGKKIAKIFEEIDITGLMHKQIAY